MRIKFKKHNPSGSKKRFWNFILWLFLIFVSLTVIAVFVLRVTYPPDKIKILIAEKVTQTTGRNFQMEDLSFSLFGRLDIRGLSLGFDPSEKMGDQPFLKFKRLSVRFRLLPLLIRKAEIKEIVVEAPELYLAPPASQIKEEVQTTAKDTSQTLKPLPVS